MSNVIPEHLRGITESEAIIKANENVVGTGIWNIGNELKYIRDNKTYMQKGYGDFQEYCEKELNYSRSMAYNFIVIAEKYPRVQSIGHIGVTKLLEVAKLPEETRKAVIENAPLSGMTVKEVQELRKQLQEREKEIRAEAEHRETLESTIKQMSKQIQELKNKPAEVKTVEKVVEKPVIPDDYEQIKREKQQLIEQNKTLLEQKQQLARQLQESRVLQSEIINIEEFRQNIGYFLEKMAKYTFYSEAFATLDKRQQNEFLKQVEKIDIWVTEVKQAIKGLKSEKTIIFEGGFISE